MGQEQEVEGIPKEWWVSGRVGVGPSLAPCTWRCTIRGCGGEKGRETLDWVEFERLG